MHDMVETMT